MGQTKMARSAKQLITQHRVEEIYRLITEATAPVTGEEFFHALMRKLALVLGVRWTFITECVDYPTTRVRILSWWAGDGFGENIEFDLEGTPCEEVVKQGAICFHPQDVGKYFPADRYITGMEGYIGIPIFSGSRNKVIGHIAIFDDRQISDELVVESVFRIFAARAGAELQRMQAEQALQASEEKYRLLVENQTDLVIKLDSAGKLLFASPSYWELFADMEGDILGNGELSLVHKDDHAATRRAWQPLLTAPYTGGVRHRVRTARGWRWLSWAAKGMVGPNQQVTEIVAVGRDVTELHRAEEIVRLVIEATAPVTGEEFCRAMTRRLATALGVRWTFVTSCLDFPTTRVLMQAYWKDNRFADPLRFDLAGTPCEEVIRDGKLCFYPNNLKHYFPKEPLRAESYIGIPIFESSSDRVIGHIAIFDDKEISDEMLIESAFRVFAARAGAELQRMQAAEALAASEEKYRLLVENQTDLVVKMNKEGSLTFVSPSCCEMFERTEEQLLGTSFARLLGSNGSNGDSVPPDIWSGLFKPPHRCQLETRTMTASGWRRLSWVAKAVLDEKHNVIEVVAGGRDITEQKRAEEQARQHMNELAHVSRLSSMGEMASALAHEVNQPLASILSYTQACLRLLKSDNHDTSELRAAMERVAHNAERAGEIVRHLRDFVRKDEPSRTPVNVNYLVREVYRLMRTEMRQNSIAFSFDLAENLEPVVVDNIQLQQVVFNLLRNGMEAINASAGEERHLSIRTSRGNGHDIEIAVSDSGMGIAAAIADRLFEPFVTTKPGGMGIGLSISRSIVETHGGRLWATANPKGGTTFHIRLPGGSESDAVNT
jgi:two-component system, LuxR family, sensor kinase FixL